MERNINSGCQETTNLIKTPDEESEMLKDISEGSCVMFKRTTRIDSKTTGDECYQKSDEEELQKQRILKDSGGMITKV